MPNGGYVVENGISLCSVCHLTAEMALQSGDATLNGCYCPRSLYALIGSSYEAAKLASTRLRSDAV